MCKIYVMETEMCIAKPLVSDLGLRSNLILEGFKWKFVEFEVSLKVVDRIKICWNGAIHICKYSYISY